MYYVHSTKNSHIVQRSLRSSAKPRSTNCPANQAHTSSCLAYIMGMMLQVHELLQGRASSTHIKYLTIMERECGYGLGNLPQLEDVSNFLKRKLTLISGSWWQPAAFSKNNCLTLKKHEAYLLGTHDLFVRLLTYIKSREAISLNSEVLHAMYSPELSSITPRILFTKFQELPASVCDQLLASWQHVTSCTASPSGKIIAVLVWKYTKWLTKLPALEFFWLLLGPKIRFCSWRMCYSFSKWRINSTLFSLLRCFCC